MILVIRAGDRGGSAEAGERGAASARGQRPRADRQLGLINQLRHAIERVAPTNSRVLISGPAGSGKEVLARLIHARSRRSPGPFLVLNCASMSPERMEVELFGMEGPLERGGTQGGHFRGGA